MARRFIQKTIGVLAVLASLAVGNRQNPDCFLNEQTTLTLTRRESPYQERADAHSPVSHRVGGMGLSSWKHGMQFAVYNLTIRDR